MKRKLMAIVMAATILGCSQYGDKMPQQKDAAAVTSSSKDITDFSILGVTGTITGNAVSLTVPYGTNVTALVATFTTTGASINIAGTDQVSGTTANNFSTPQTYTVVAADGSTKNYTVTVTVALATSKDITAFSILGASGTITGSSISVTVPYGTNVTALVATFTTTGASVNISGANQVSGTTANNFSTAKTYTVVAADSSTKNYTVTVTVALNTAKDISTFSISGISGTITGNTIAVTVPYGTNVTALVATFTITGASVNISGTSQVSGTTANNFATAKTYTVVAADGSTKNYTVTVTVNPTPPVAAQWARSVTSGSDDSRFQAVAVDSAGNIYAAGYQYGTGSYTYGSGVSVAGTYNGNNIVLVKYNSAGTAQWARSITSGSGESQFNAVAVDSSGNIYAAGYQKGSGSYTYGSGVSVAGSASGTYYNVVLLKYNSSGTAQWARSVTSSSYTSRFNAVAVDSSGNIYAAGAQPGTGSSYGSGVFVKGSYGGTNIVLVKYNSAGTAQWVRSATDGSDSSEFNAIAVDSSGNIYAAGTQVGTGSNTYDTGVSVAGSGGMNIVLVKYNSAGTAKWARSVTSGGAQSEFYAVAADSAGNIYAAGRQNGNASYTYGSGVSVAGGASDNIVLVKYNSSGTAQWARSVPSGSTSWFNSVAIDSSGNIYAAGYQYGT
ncbi:MAG TPA: hypothetical protein PLY93_12480, partial [Turneriella sp.]|nr:hypothetical protein [Turneriella sp.]